MAWASTDIVPAQLNLSTNLSISAGTFTSITQKISPVSSTGSLFNFTAASGVSADTSSNVNLPAPLVATGANALTLGTHDATGLSFTADDTALQVLLLSMSNLSIPITLVATDGTTPLIVGKGTISVTLIP